MSGKIHASAIGFLLDYIFFFFGIIFFTLILDVCGIFDKISSFYAKRSYRNLSEAIHRSKSKKHYIEQLEKDRYERMPFTTKISRCFRREKINESEVDIEEVENQFSEWKKTRKVNSNEIENKKGKCSFHKKENLSEYYFTELLNISYLGTRAYRRNAASEKISMCGFFYLHFSRGFLSDFIFYIMNNHSFLSMFMAVRGHPFSRNARRLTYLSANCVTFFFAILLSKMDTVNANLISVLAISPLVIIIRKWMFSLLACPCYRPVLERENQDCAHCCYTCLGETSKLFAYFCVLCFITILFPAALLTSQFSTNGTEAIISYSHSVILTSFGQEFIYALLVFWTGEACVTIKFCGTNVLGYGGYFKDKVHILGLKGLRLQLLQLTVMQEKLERRLEKEARERNRLESLEYGEASKKNASNNLQPDENDDSDEEDVAAAENAELRPSFRRSVSMKEVPPSILHQYDYAIQEMEWLRYLTCSIIQVEFYLSIPFIREFVRDLKDEYADMEDDDASSVRSDNFSTDSSNGVELEDVDDALPDKLISSAIDKWNRLFVPSVDRTSTKDSNSARNSTQSVDQNSRSSSTSGNKSATPTTIIESPIHNNDAEK